MTKTNWSFSVGGLDLDELPTPEFWIFFVAVVVQAFIYVTTSPVILGYRAIRFFLAKVSDVAAWFVLGDKIP